VSIENELTAAVKDGDQLAGKEVGYWGQRKGLDAPKSVVGVVAVLLVGAGTGCTSLGQLEEGATKEEPNDE
jgi:hypothetical protein